MTTSWVCDPHSLRGPRGQGASPSIYGSDKTIKSSKRPLYPAHSSWCQWRCPHDDSQICILIYLTSESLGILDSFIWDLMRCEWSQTRHGVCMWVEEMRACGCLLLPASSSPFNTHGASWAQASGGPAACGSSERRQGWQGKCARSVTDAPFEPELAVQVEGRWWH